MFCIHVVFAGTSHINKEHLGLVFILDGQIRLICWFCFTEVQHNLHSSAFMAVPLFHLSLYHFVFFSNSPSCVPNVTHSIISTLCLLRYSIVASLVLHCTSLLFPLLIYIIRIYHFLQVCLLRPCFHYLFLYCYNWCYFLWFNETL